MDRATNYSEGWQAKSCKRDDFKLPVIFTI